MAAKGAGDEIGCAEGMCRSAGVDLIVPACRAWGMQSVVHVEQTDTLHKILRPAGRGCCEDTGHIGLCRCVRKVEGLHQKTVAGLRAWAITGAECPAIVCPHSSSVPKAGCTHTRHHSPCLLWIGLKRGCKFIHSHVAGIGFWIHDSAQAADAAPGGSLLSSLEQQCSNHSSIVHTR